MYTRNLFSLIGILFSGYFLVGRVKADCQFTTTGGKDVWSGCTANSFIHTSEACTSGNACIKTGDLIETDDHIIYYCSSATSCEKLTSGYYINGTTVYSCASSGGTCKQVTPASASACSSNPGEVINDDSEFKFCPDTTANPVKIAANAGDYVVASSNNNVFGIANGKYGVVTITDKNIKINTSANPTYAYSTYKIISNLSALTCTEDLLPKSFASFSNGLGGSATDISLTSGKNYLLETVAADSKYCGAALNSGNIKLSDVTDSNLVIDSSSPIISIFYEVLTDLTTVTLTNIKLLKCTNTSGTCAVDNGYIIYGTDGTANSLALCTSGVCSANTEKGYFVNAQGGTTPFIKCSSTCEAVAASGSCGNENIGKLISDGNSKLCLDGSVSAPFVTTGSGNYLVGYATGSFIADVITDNKKFGVVKITKNSITLDTTFTTDYGICVNKSDKTVTKLTESSTACDTSSNTKYDYCVQGVCYNVCKVASNGDCENDTYYYVKSKELSIPKTDGTDGLLFHCISGEEECTEITAKGYYFNDADNIYSCEGTSGSCVKETTALATACDANSVGKLFNDLDLDTVKFCLSFTNPDPNPVTLTTTTTTYLLPHSSSNVFGVTDTGSFGLISATAKSVSLLNQVSGHCVAGTNYSLITDGTTAGTLYTCTNGVCHAETAVKVGYYKNAGNTGTEPYIACSSTTSCTSYTADTATCAASGKIYSVTNGGETTYHLCLKASDANVELTGTGEYFIDVNVDNIVFGKKENKFAIITIENGNVFLKGIEQEVERYRYGDANQKVLNFTIDTDKNANCDTNNGITTLNSSVKEYALSDAEDGDTTDYYTVAS